MLRSILSSHRLLQPLTSPFTYNPNQNSPAFVLTLPSIHSEERPHSTVSLSSSSSGFTTPPIQTTPPLPDGGVGYARPAGTPPRAVPHSQHTIRDNTMELSGLLVSSVVTSSSVPSAYNSSDGSQPQSEWTPSVFAPHNFGALDSAIQVEPRSLTGDSATRSTENNGRREERVPLSQNTETPSDIERGR